MGNPILKVVNLNKRFGGIMAIDDVSFELEPGSSLGIIGPNGSGKTTLVNLITGFIKPDSGKVFFQEKDITGAAPYKITNLGVARTFQMVKPFSQLPAYKNLIVPLYSPRVQKSRGGKFGDRDDIAIDLLGDVGFERDSAIPYKAAGSLPHGYLKRLELARCQSLRPDLIILDELFSGMSISEVASTVPLIQKMNGEGKTLVIIEHRLKELFRIVNKIIVLNFGKKIAEGLPEEVMKKEEVKRAYVGSEVEYDVRD